MQVTVKVRCDHYGSWMRDSKPTATANNDANLIHGAAIGKIAGEQLIKLMTLGLTEEDRGTDRKRIFEITDCHGGTTKTACLLWLCNRKRRLE